jgi:hypothetical protein
MILGMCRCAFRVGYFQNGNQNFFYFLFDAIVTGMCKCAFKVENFPNGHPSKDMFI